MLQVMGSHRGLLAAQGWRWSPCCAMLQVMVFFTTARITQIYAELFNKMGCEVLELHSRKSQAYRWALKLR